MTWLTNIPQCIKEGGGEFFMNTCLKTAKFSINKVKEIFDQLTVALKSCYFKSFFTNFLSRPHLVNFSCGPTCWGSNLIPVQLGALDLISSLPGNLTQTFGLGGLTIYAFPAFKWRRRKYIKNCSKHPSQLIFDS